MSSQLNIYIDKGTDFRLTIDLYDADDDALNVDAGTLFFGDMRKIYSTKKSAEFTFETQLANNSITFLLDSDTTSQLTPGKYQYDILKKKVDNQGNIVEISKVVEGLAFVVSTVTEV